MYFQTLPGRTRAAGCAETGGRKNFYAFRKIFMPGVKQGIRGGGECWGCPVGILEVINWGDENMPDADVVGADRLLWEVPGETVVITALRKAVQATVREWERAAWSALEGIDLHKEDGRC